MFGNHISEQHLISIEIAPKDVNFEHQIWFIQKPKKRNLMEKNMKFHEKACALWITAGNWNNLWDVWHSAETPSSKKNVSKHI